MPIEIRPQDTSTLLGMYRDVPAPVNYFRNLLTVSVYTSSEEYIDLMKITDDRKLAPLVIPTAQGRPIFTEASNAMRLKPAYVKPKDAISPSRALKRRPTENIFQPNKLSPFQRYLALVGDIFMAHRKSIDNRMEWMVANAAIYGKITLEGPDYPTTIVDFERDPLHTTTATGAGVVWSDEDALIVDQINVWVERVRRAEFGGPTNRLTLGRDVVGPFLKNKQVRELLNTDIRGTNGELNIGVRTGEYSERLGRLGNLEVWTTSDWYTLPEGAGTAEYMPAKGVLLTGPNLNMTECYGAILDFDAQLQALPVFPKQWKNEDPSVTYLMTQSAPLAVPVNANNSLFATVID